MRQLYYYTTSSPLCQHLFTTFFPEFSLHSPRLPKMRQEVSLPAALPSSKYRSPILTTARERAMICTRSDRGAGFISNGAGGQPGRREGTGKGILPKGRGWLPFPLVPRANSQGTVIIYYDGELSALGRGRQAAHAFALV